MCTASCPFEFGSDEAGGGFLVAAMTSAFCSNKSLKVHDTDHLQLELGFKMDRNCAFIVRGDGFLYHMVRILVGTLLEVGMGQRSPMDLPDILSAQNREAAGYTVPACGLFLMEVTYQ